MSRTEERRSAWRASEQADAAKHARASLVRLEAHDGDGGTALYAELPVATTEASG